MPTSSRFAGIIPPVKAAYISTHNLLPSMRAIWKVTGKLLGWHACTLVAQMGVLLLPQNEAILLTHFSQRYSAQKIVELLDAGLPPELRQKCTPLLAGFT